MAAVDAAAASAESYAAYEVAVDIAIDSFFVTLGWEVALSAAGLYAIWELGSWLYKCAFSKDLMPMPRDGDIGALTGMSWSSSLRAL